LVLHAADFRQFLQMLQNSLSDASSNSYSAIRSSSDKRACFCALLVDDQTPLGATSGRDAIILLEREG
jgi:hypothetical protein